MQIKRWLMMIGLFAMGLGTWLHAGTVREEQAKMGSPFEITAVHDDPALARVAITAAWAEIDRLEAMISSWQETSQTSAVNRNAGVAPVPVSPELFGLIRRALKVSKLTGGAFDISFASAGRFWDFRTGKLPEPAVVAQAVRAIDYRKIQLKPDQQTVYLDGKGTRIGFGAIGKGYAANRALHILKQYGIAHALVNAGGDLVATGQQEDGKPWAIAIAHPRQPGQLLARLNLTEQAVVTSGDYERFFMHEGKRYTHIIDPRTGYPVEGVMSVTVICPDAELADALATSVFVLGRKDGLNLINRLARVESIVVTADGQVHYSRNMQQQLVQTVNPQKEPSK